MSGPRVDVVLLGPPRCGAGLLRTTMCTDATWIASSSGSADSWRKDARGDSRVGVDWHPESAMRVTALADASPQAKFVLMVRRPVPTISSLMEAWRSRRFVRHPELPGWWGEPWSFPLIEGWRDLIGAPPARVCSSQWAQITTRILDDLATLPADRWTVTSFEGLLDDPSKEIATLVDWLGVPWSGTIHHPLPLTESVVSPPRPGKWLRDAHEIAAFAPEIDDVVHRLRGVALGRRSDLPWPELERPSPEETDIHTLDSRGTPFASSHTRSVADLLAQVGASLVVSTYKSGHVIIVRNDDGVVNTEFTNVSRAMGVAVAGNRMAIGGADAILAFTGQPAISPHVPSPKPVDVAYAPRSVVFTGDVAVHDMAYGWDGTLYFVNTRFSCLCRQDVDYSFVPVWRPTWISGLAAEDRCHLNGLAMVDGSPRYVTALAETDDPVGWRHLKGTSGVVVDIADDRVVARGLAMPHSPRWHDGRLFVLESGVGSLASVDVVTGEVTRIAELPGFTRGLAFIGPYALVGLSQVRESVFVDLPITSKATERNCGVWVVDTRDGGIVGFLRFGGVVQEVFDVAVLPGRWPTIIDAGELTLSAFVLPDEVLTEMVSEHPSTALP